MKEYLVKKGNTYYADTNPDDFSEVICEIPDGADAARKFGDSFEFYKNDFGMFFDLVIRKWCPTVSPKQVFVKNLIWQRQESSEVSVKHSHYKKDVSQYEIVDVYRVLELFNVTNPCLQHAIKKLLCAGERGVKDADKDIQEAIDTLNRYKEMKIEDSK